MPISRRHSLLLRPARQRKRFRSTRITRGPPHVRQEISPIDQLHGQEPAPALGKKLIESNEVRVNQTLKRSEFFLESIKIRRIQPVQSLERHSRRRTLSSASKTMPMPPEPSSTRANRSVPRNGARLGSIVCVIAARTCGSIPANPSAGQAETGGRHACSGSALAWIVFHHRGDNNGAVPPKMGLTSFFQAGASAQTPKTAIWPLNPMTETLEALILDLLEWLESRERSYAEVMDAWAHVVSQAPGVGGCD